MIFELVIVTCALVFITFGWTFQITLESLFRFSMFFWVFRELQTHPNSHHTARDTPAQKQTHISLHPSPSSRTAGREFWKFSGGFKCLELQGFGDPSRVIEGNSRKSSESGSGVFPELFRNFSRKVPAVLGAWLRRGPTCGERGKLEWVWSLLKNYLNVLLKPRPVTNCRSHS